MRKKQNQEEEQEPLGSLPEGPLVEILSRVPYRSLCRFKCVSKRPTGPPTSSSGRRRPCPASSAITCVASAICPGEACLWSTPFSLSCARATNFSSPNIAAAAFSSAHAGNHFISEADEYNLVVCNPATENWTELPHYPIASPYEAVHYLGFDPATPSRFVVFTHLWKLEEMAIYSSDTGRWTTVETGWTSQHYPIGPSNCVFLNGTLHLMTFGRSIVTVELEGKVWREIEVPGNMARRCAGPSIGQSQGCLYAWYTDNPKVCRLSVWALEEYASAKWTFKHTVNILELFGRHTRTQDESYTMFAIHPDHNLIFITNGKEKTISYDMDNQGVHVRASPLVG
uniref:Uncharacterized protein n=1 Tax=Avena sativa TaxID=4498 RepID=A0ACD5ZN45_AVESA